MQISPLRPETRGAFLSLWKAAFGDEADVYEAMEACFGPALESFVLTETPGGDVNCTAGASQDNAPGGDVNCTTGARQDNAAGDVPNAAAGDVPNTTAGDVVAALTQFVMGRLASQQPSVGAYTATPPESALQPSSAGARAATAAASAPQPVYVSYAINTRADARGRGYGSAITDFARDLAHSRGGVSVLCPATPSLLDFYRPLGYAPWGYALQKPLYGSLSDPILDHRRTPVGPSDGCSVGIGLPTATASFKIGLPAATASFKPLTADEYQSLRERALADRAHVTLSNGALAFICRTVSGLIEIELSISNPGDRPSYPAAVQAVAAYTTSAEHGPAAESDAAISHKSDESDASLFIDELIVTELDQPPADFSKEAAVDLAAAFLADHFGASRCVYRTPAPAESNANDPDLYVQAMIALPDSATNSAAEFSAADFPATLLPYFGFPFD